MPPRGPHYPSQSKESRALYRLKNLSRIRANGRRYYHTPKAIALRLRKKETGLSSGYSAKHRAKRLALMRAAKDVPCVDCGRRYPPWVMDFDHIRGEKKFSIGSSYFARCEATVAAEIAKCDVVCANCHRDRTHKNKYAKPPANS